MPTTNTARSTDHVPEADAFAGAIAAVSADRVTACRAWTAHDLLAHVVAGGAEILRQVTATLAGEASTTTPFAEREQPVRQLDFATLAELATAGGLLDAIGRLGAADLVPFTGWAMDRSSLLHHVRSELAIHRWDLVGGDDLSLELLAAPELTAHAVTALGAFEAIDERFECRTVSTESTVYRLRVAGEPDVVIEIDDAMSRVRLDAEADPDDPGVTTDAAARLLMLWGRRPTPDRHHATTDLDAQQLAQLERWLYG